MDPSFVVITDPQFSHYIKDIGRENREIFADRVKKYCKGVEYLFLIGDLTGDLFDGDDRTAKIWENRRKMSPRVRGAYSDMLETIEKVRKSGYLPRNTFILADTTMCDGIPNEMRFEFKDVEIGDMRVAGLPSPPLRHEFQDGRIIPVPNRTNDVLWDGENIRRPDFVILGQTYKKGHLDELLKAHSGHTVKNPGLYVISRHKKENDYDGELAVIVQDVTGFRESGITRYTLGEAGLVRRLRHRLVDGKLKSIGQQVFKNQKPLQTAANLAETTVMLPYPTAVERLKMELDTNVFLPQNEQGLPPDLRELRTAIIEYKKGIEGEGLKLAGEISELETAKADLEAKLAEAPSPDEVARLQEELKKRNEAFQKLDEGQHAYGRKIFDLSKLLEEKEKAYKADLLEKTKAIQARDVTIGRLEEQASKGAAETMKVLEKRGEDELKAKSAKGDAERELEGTTRRLNKTGTDLAEAKRYLEQYSRELQENEDELNKIYAEKSEIQRKLDLAEGERIKYKAGREAVINQAGKNMDTILKLTDEKTTLQERIEELEKENENLKKKKD